MRARAAFLYRPSFRDRWAVCTVLSSPCEAGQVEMVQPAQHPEHHVGLPGPALTGCPEGGALTLWLRGPEGAPEPLEGSGWLCTGPAELLACSEQVCSGASEQ